MAHYVIITAGVVSHLNRAFGLGGLLRDRGHRVTFVSARHGAAGLVRHNDFEFCALDTPRQFIRLPGRLRERRERVAREAAAARRILDSTEFDRLTAALQPDLLLIDYELHSQIIRAIAVGRPTMLLEYECSPRRTGRVPVPSSNLMPTGSALNRLLVAGSWWAESGKRRLRFGLSRAYYAGHDRWSTIRRLAARHGVELRRHATRRHWHFLTYPELPTLYLSPWEFDFPNQIPNREFYVGPMLHGTRREAAVDPDYGALMQRLDQGSCAQVRPVVYCAMGSILADPAYFRRVIEAAGRHPEWDVIIAAGGAMSRRELGGMPPNVHVLAFVPQLDVLRRADLMLTHAGSGSVFECIQNGVPMLCYSGGAKEENGNAARVAFHGLGLRGDPVRDGPAEIAARIQTLLTDPTYRSRVTGMRERLRHYAQTDRVAELLESAVHATPAELGWRAVR
jgi:UDP:flavonoid glycosyltransferase YjiC (YdhE family)